MPTKNHKKGNKRKSNFHAGGNNTHLSICGGNKLSGLPPTANVPASVHVAYNVGNPQHHALVNLFPTCCDLQKQGMKPKPNACPDCLKQYLLNPRCRNIKHDQIRPIVPTPEPSYCSIAPSDRNRLEEYLHIVREEIGSGQILAAMGDIEKVRTDIATCIGEVNDVSTSATVISPSGKFSEEIKEINRIIGRRCLYINRLHNGINGVELGIHRLVSLSATDSIILRSKMCGYGVEIIPGFTAFAAAKDQHVSTCPAGTSSNNGKCTECAAGWYSSAGSACQKCAKGTYSLAAGASPSDCHDCAAGTYSSSAGASACHDCPTGTYSSAGASACKKCAAGSYSYAGSANCHSCPAGAYCPGGSTWSWCAAGTYSSAGASACQKCPAGTYRKDLPAATAGACLPCPAGKYSSAGASACLPCPAGAYSSAAAAACTCCSAGTYNPTAGADVCITCPDMPKNSCVYIGGDLEPLNHPCNTYTDAESCNQPGCEWYDGNAELMECAVHESCIV